MNMMMMMMTLLAEVSAAGKWDSAIELAVQFLTPVLMVLVGWAAVKLQKKLGLEGVISLDEIAVANVRKGIGYAERWAKKKLHDGGSANGDMKLTKAIDFIAALEGKLNLSEKLADVISRRIHTELGVDDRAIVGTGPDTPAD